MKTRKLFFKTAVITGILLISNIISAQRGNCKGPRYNEDFKCSNNSFCLSIPDLTDEQTEQIKQLRIAHLKEVKGLKNELNEKQARHQTLMTSDIVKMDEINKNIDEIIQIKSALMKAKAAHKQAVRDLLNEEQKLYFDVHLIRKNCYGHRNKHGHKHKHNRYYVLDEVSDADLVDLIEQ